MYTEVTEALVSTSSPGSGALEEFAQAVGDTFISVLPVAIPIVGAIAIGFFAIRVVRGLLNA